MIPVEFPPGVTTLLSRTAKISNWRDANLVRWDDGVTLKPIGGWEQIPYTLAFASRCRRMHKWTAKDQVLYTAYLCEQHVYVDAGGALIDITPAGGMIALTADIAGYGENIYNLSTYGTARPGLSTIQKFSPAWTLDNWGEDLLVMTSYDGRLLRWGPASPPGTKLIAVAGAPVNNRQFIVTPEHHCMLFGMSADFGRLGWCSKEDLADWNFPSTTNTAGDWIVDPYSPIVAAQLSDAGITVHTPANTHIVEWIGLPYVYRVRPIGKVPIPISASSVVTIPEGIVWASVEGFWLYNGSVADIIPCPIWDTIKAKMDFGKTVRESNMVNMLNRGEIWWFWVDPTLGQTTGRYAMLDYRSKIWAPGILSRTCGVMYGNDRFPLMSDGTKIWKHETGFVYPDAPMPFLESQTLSVQSGERWATISKLLPDIAGAKSALAFRVAKNNDRTNYALETYSPQRIVNEHGWVDIRETARDMRLRVDMVQNADWSTVGPILFDIKPRGKKK